MLWDLVEDIKLRVHEHLGPVRGVKFFGEEDRFIFSCDYRTIIISEWHSLNRVAELGVPLKKTDSPCRQVLMDYLLNTMIIAIPMQRGYRLSILSFKEFSLQFVFGADFRENHQPLQIKILETGRGQQSILVVETSSVKVW